MEKIFCPFIKDDCNFLCIFNNGCFGEDDPENCNLMCAVRVIQSFETTELTPQQLLDNITSKLSNIDFNTGNDQTYSSDIRDELQEIKELLSSKER